MRAARLQRAREVRIEEVPTPQPGPGEVLVRVRACSICHSDVLIYETGEGSGGAVPPGPFIQGHEFAGEVVALGPQTDGPAPGTRVAVDPCWHCGECDMCRRGLTNICRHIVFPSFPPRDGALAEYLACPAFSLCPLPDNVSFTEGALLEPLGVGVHALRLAGPIQGLRVAVLGAGMIGAGVLALAHRQGPGELAVVEPVAGRREFAQSLGAEPAVAAIGELLDRGWEADVVVECAGETDSLEQALELVGPGGRIVMIGIPQVDRISFPAPLARRKEVNLLFSRRSRQTLPECVELVARGEVNLRAFPTRTFSLEQTAEALEATAARPGDMLRAIVIP